MFSSFIVIIVLLSLVFSTSSNLILCANFTELATTTGFPDENFTTTTVFTTIHSNITAPVSSLSSSITQTRQQQENYNGGEKTHTISPIINLNPQDEEDSVSTFLEISSVLSIAGLFFTGSSPPVLQASVKNLLFLRSAKCGSFLVTNDDDQRISPRHNFLNVEIPLHPTRLSTTSSTASSTSSSSSSFSSSHHHQSLTKIDGISELLSNYQGLIIAGGLILLLPISGSLFLGARVISIFAKRDRNQHYYHDEKSNTNAGATSFIQVLENVRFSRVVYTIWSLVITPSISAFTAIFAFRDRSEENFILANRTTTTALFIFLMSISVVMVSLPLFFALWSSIVAGRSLTLVYDSKRDYAKKERQRREEFLKVKEERARNNQLFSLMTDEEQEYELEKERIDDEENANHSTRTTSKLSLDNNKRLKHFAAYWCVAIDGNDWDIQHDAHVRRFGVFFEHTNSPFSVPWELFLGQIATAVALGFTFSVIWRMSHFVSYANLINFAASSSYLSLSSIMLSQALSALTTCQLAAAFATGSELLIPAFYIWRRPILKRIDALSLAIICGLNIIFSSLNTAKFYQYSAAITKLQNYVQHQSSLDIASFLDQKFLPNLEVVCRVALFIISLMYVIFAVGRWREAEKIKQKKKKRQEDLERIRTFGGGFDEVNLNDLAVLEEELILNASPSSGGRRGQHPQNSNNQLLHPSLNETLEELLIETENEAHLYKSSLDSKYIKLQEMKQQISSRRQEEEMRKKEEERRLLMEDHSQDPFHHVRKKIDANNNLGDDDTTSDENEEEENDEFDFSSLEYFCTTDEERNNIRTLFDVAQKRGFTSDQLRCIRLLQHFDPIALVKLPNLFQTFRSNTGQLLKNLSCQYCGIPVPPMEIVNPPRQRENTKKKKQRRQRQKKMFDIRTTKNESGSEKNKRELARKNSSSTSMKLIYEASSSSSDGEFEANEQNSNNNTNRQIHTISPKSIIQQACEEKVLEIFEKFDPKVTLAEINELLRLFEGNELDLLYKLEMRYGCCEEDKLSSSSSSLLSKTNNNKNIDETRKHHRHHLLSELNKPSKQLAMKHLDDLRMRVRRMKQELDETSNTDDQDQTTSSTLMMTRKRLQMFYIDLAKKIIKQYDPVLSNNKESLESLLNRFRGGRESILVETLEKKYLLPVQSRSLTVVKNTKPSERYFSTNGFDTISLLSMTNENEDEELDDYQYLSNNKRKNSITTTADLSTLLVEAPIQKKLISSRRQYLGGIHQDVTSLPLLPDEVNQQHRDHNDVKTKEKKNSSDNHHPTSYDVWASFVDSSDKTHRTQSSISLLQQQEQEEDRKLKELQQEYREYEEKIRQAPKVTEDDDEFDPEMLFRRKIMK